MKITNSEGLPTPLVSAITAIRNKYSKGDAQFSATELSKPPLMVRLIRDHFEEIETDVVDSLWAVFGSALHYILEAYAGDDHIPECRFFATIEGWRISGAADLYFPDSGLLQDYKMTSVWTVVYDGVRGRAEWGQQLNVLAELIKINGGQVSRIEDVLLFRDWSQSQALKGGNYPQSKAQVIEQVLYPSEMTRAWIADRCKQHQDALDAMDPSHIVCCTPEEQWAKPDTWAVMREGRKTAVRVFDNEQEAKALVAVNGNGHRIEHRPGKRTRCESYCDGNRWCPYFKQEDPTEEDEKKEFWKQVDREKAEDRAGPNPYNKKTRAEESSEDAE